jgi:hypothetical protein
MTASSTPAASWTALLATAAAHDINNLVHSFSISDSTEWAACLEECVDPLRKLGVRLRALGATYETKGPARLDDACADALTEVDPDGRRVRRAPLPGAGAVVRGTDAALRTAIATLLEHALAASPTGAPIQLAVRDEPPGAIVVDVAAPEATGLGPIAVAPLDALLATTLRDLRGDFSLVLAGAIADAVGGTVTVASSVESGLVLGLHLVVA